MEIFSKRVILVCDDDSGNRNLVVSALSTAAPGARVLAAADGKSAIEILSRRAVDVVLLDWEMPEMNGYEVLLAMKQSETWRSIPVIMYTGVMTKTENLMKAMEAGALDFIRKPTESIEVIARIANALAQKKEQNDRLVLERENANMRNEFLRKELEWMKHELNSYLLQLSRKNEALISLKEQIIAEISESATRERVLSHLDTAIGEEHYWDEFLSRFSRLDMDFLNRLSNLAPDLTGHEIKFCAYIRAGMSSKELANLLNITLSAVEKNRYRIRKKLNINQEQNLDQYLFSI